MFTDHKKITSHGLHSGFTLIEVLVSITVFLLLLGIFTNFIVQSYRLQTYDVEQGEAVRQARNGVEKMVKELREVTYADDGSYGIVPGSALMESITFYSDVDLDQSTERIRYFLENNQLRYKTFPAEQSFRKAQDRIFSTKTDGLTFEYYNLASPPLAVAPEFAAKVKMTLSLRQKSGSDYEVVVATSEASLRND